MDRLQTVLAAAAVTLAMSSTAAMADWRDEVVSLKIGVVADAGAAYTRVRLERFRTFIEARIELPVEIVAFPHYGVLIDAHAAGRTDYAIHTALSYVATVLNCRCVEPVAAPLAADGARGFHAVLIARSGSGIDSLSDLAGVRLALSGGDSVAGHLAPLHALEGEGLDPDADLAAIVTAADPEDALTMLFTDEADVAAAWSSLQGERTGGYSFGVLATMVAAGSLAMDQIGVVWQSPLIPFGPHAVRSDLPPELKILLLDALSSVGIEAPEILDDVDRSTNGGGGFARVEPGDYAFIEEVVVSSGG